MLKNGILALALAGALTASAAVPADAARGHDLFIGGNSSHFDRHIDRGDRGGGGFFFGGGPMFDFNIGRDCDGLYGRARARCLYGD
jgi:hypothetical protein